MLSLLTAAVVATARLAAAAPDVVELHDGTRCVGELQSRKGPDVALLSALGPQLFAASDVARVERRADLLASYRAALATAGGTSHAKPHALVTLAQWCLDRGLYPEAFDCADRARAAAAATGEPATDAGMNDLQMRLANEALLDGAVPSLWPDVERRERLLDRIAGRSPSRAAYARALLSKAAVEELLPWLITELADLDSDVRIGAAELLGDLKSDKGLSKLIRASLLDPNSRVRDHARAAALRSGHPDLARPYLKMLESEDPRMRERAYPALAEMAELGDPRIVPALIGMFDPRPVPQDAGGGYSPPRSYINIGQQISYVQDFDVEIAQGAVIAKPIIGIIQTGVVLDVAVAGVVVISHVERAVVMRTLRKVSGRDLGDDPTSWKSWWSAEAAAARASTPTNERSE